MKVASSVPNLPSQLTTPSKKPFFRKYFMEGQSLHDGTHTVLAPDADFIDKLWHKYRKYLGILLPEAVMLTLWLLTAIRYDWFSLYPTHWQLPLVMILGASVAGLTAESGGAVAFPVMTLAMKIEPKEARDFSLLIEAISMTCATIAITIMGVRIEPRSVLFGTIGSIFGLIVGFNWLDSILDGSQKKMLFVSIWASFAIALFLLNQEKKRKTFMKIPEFKAWKAMTLILTGVVGGILTAFIGSGVDICLFSVITILFRVSEKVATPTTVVLMGINALIGSYYRVIWIGGVSQQTFDFLKVCAPVVLIVAPTMSLIGSHFHRQVLAFFVYILEALAVIGFVITGPKAYLLVIGTGIILIGFLFFYSLCKLGERLMRQIDERRSQKVQLATVA